ncbi:MAG: hypothetical protein GX804_02385, partial [Lentisphaerae bacterium]|nr:hypothetical protein [Lentisphaerota bacterium]
GEGYSLSATGSTEVDALVRVRDSPEFTDITSKLKPGDKATLKAVGVPAGALQQGTLGRFYARVGGEICKSSSGWTFTGEVFYDDLYDYITPGGVPDPGDLPPKTNVSMPYSRTTGGIHGGQGKVEWAEKNIPGCPFWVRSPVMNVSATDKDYKLRIVASSSRGGGEWRK